MEAFVPPLPLQADCLLFSNERSVGPTGLLPTYSSYTFRGPPQLSSLWLPGLIPPARFDVLMVWPPCTGGSGVWGSCARSLGPAVHRRWPGGLGYLLYKSGFPGLAWQPQARKGGTEANTPVPPPAPTPQTHHLRGSSVDPAGRNASYRARRTSFLSVCDLRVLGGVSLPRRASPCLWGCQEGLWNPQLLEGKNRAGWGRGNGKGQ